MHLLIPWASNVVSAQLRTDLTWKMRCHCFRMCYIVNSLALITDSLFFYWYWFHILLCVCYLAWRFDIWDWFKPSDWTQSAFVVFHFLWCQRSWVSSVLLVGNWTFVLTVFTFWKLAWLIRQGYQAARCLIPHHEGTEGSLAACHKNAV